MIRVSFEEVHSVLTRALLALGFEPTPAQLCARLFAETSRDGVYSHGLNRFPKFGEQIRRGVVDIPAGPRRVAPPGRVERWDGKTGPGNPKGPLLLPGA